jgi:hypothetical protein
MSKLPYSSKRKWRVHKGAVAEGCEVPPGYSSKREAQPTWAEKSANIAGLTGWTDEQAEKFLMTGLAYNDLPARPPMPRYRFNREDAEAIVAYLRSPAK